MSGKKLRDASALEPKVAVAARQTKLELGADTVSIHKSGIEFRSPTAFEEWTEMTVSLQSPVDGSRLSCNGVVVACAGNRHTGYHVSMVFTSLTRQAENRLNAMAHSAFGVS